MPVKNKKIKLSATKKQGSKSSRPAAKKIAPKAKKVAKIIKTVKAPPKKKLEKKSPPKAKALLKKPSAKKISTQKLPAKKKVSIRAAKSTKKVKAVKTSTVKKTTINKKSIVLPTKARVTTASKTTKAAKKMVTKAVESAKKTISPTKSASPPPKTFTVIAQSHTPAHQQKLTIKKPLATQTVKPVKTMAKKTHVGQPPTLRVKRPGAGPSGFLPYETSGGEDYMSDTQLAHFQQVLNLWKAQLYADRDATAQHMRDDTINFPDPLDRAALEEEHTLEWRAREREHKLIAKIDQALAHIKQGEYGYCEACGAEIGVRRLEARPTATQCIDCKTIDEIRERHTGTAE